MSVAYEKIKGGFAFMDAPFAVHPNDQSRAEEYRDAVLAAGLQWPDIEADVRAYAKEQGWTPNEIEKQIGLVKRFFGGSST